jgi:predicted dienelactone hydrolase
VIIAFRPDHLARACLLAALLVIVLASNALAGADPVRTGISRLSVGGTDKFDVMVWYPTGANGVPWQTDFYPIPATHDAAVAASRFPVVLLSHGGSVTGGKPLVLSELSADLARHGFVIVAPFHGTTGLLRRTFQVHEALDAVLADPRFKPHMDATRIGMLGFSLGGAVTLILAGAIPDFAHLDAYGDAHPGDVMSCDYAPGGGGRRTTAIPWWAFWVRPPQRAPPLPLKAIELLDPFAALFPRANLTAVTMPVLLFRPRHSELPGNQNAIGLAAALPHAPVYRTVPGDHFIFVDVCPPALKTVAPGACRDPQGVDRASVHADVEAQIAAFFEDRL